MNKKIIILYILGLVLITILLAIIAFNTKVHASQCKKDNDCYPTPTIKPCFRWDDDKPCPTITPTPTPTPVASPSAVPTNVPNMGGTGNIPSNPHTDTTEAPAAATCTIAFDAPKLQGFTAGASGSVTFSWWGVANIDKYSIIYGYTPDALIYGEDNISSSATQVQLNLLKPGNHVWAKVGAWRSGCEEESNILDPLVK